MRQALMMAAALWLATAEAVLAEAALLSAPEAAAQVETGEMILLDIRSAEEWAESGVADGAWPVSMHAEDFPQRLNAILARYRPDQIGLICATGGRSAYVTRVLAANGITGVVDVSEGMFGNDKGAGWIAREMPVVTVDEAMKGYEAAQEGWAD